MFLMVLRFMAILATVIFSVLAVFAEDKQQSRLPLKGRIALVTALVSGTIAFTTQALELMADRRKSAKAQAETQELLRNILHLGILRATRSRVNVPPVPLCPIVA